MLDTSSALEVVEYENDDAVGPLTAFLHQESSIPKTSVVYFYADWCAPCKRFKQAMPNEKVEEALRGVRMLEVNIDNYKQLAAHFGVKAVPTFIKVNEKGEPVAKITSAAWDKDVPKEIAPVMSKLVASNIYDAR